MLKRVDQRLSLQITYYYVQCIYLIHPECEGRPVSDEKPLSDVKLSAVDEQRTLNVFLDHPPPLLVEWTGDQLQNGLETLQTHYPCSCSVCKSVSECVCE